MNKLSQDKQAQVIMSLVEGNSICATVRMTGVAKNTIVKLLTAVGRVCNDLIKIYGPAPEGETRYSPAQCIGTEKHRIKGTPEEKAISTSYVERQNLTMRMSMRRFTRLTNAFSKKVENLNYAVALHFMYYNFCRLYQTLRVTPAMEAGVTDHVWDISEIISLI